MLALMRAVPRGRRFVKATEPTGIAAYLWNQYGDPLIQAILEAIASTQGEISARKVQIALENGDIVGALSAIPWDEVGATRLGAALPATFESAIADAGSSAAAELGDVALSFSVTRGEIAS